MSASPPYDAASLPPGDPSESPNGLSDFQAIEAELADHLACASAAAAQAGANPEAASRLAIARFGDVRRIARQCWWIQQGDKIVWKSLQTALLALIFVSVAALALAGWRWQRDFSQQMETLTDKLAVIADRPVASPAAPAPVEQEPALREIRGYAYVGDESKPAAGAEIVVYDYFNHAKVRDVHADRDGRFSTGVLPEGVYLVQAPYVSPNNIVSWHRLDSSSGPGVQPPELRPPPFFEMPLYCQVIGPLSVQTGRLIGELTLNLDFPKSHVSWELAGGIADEYQTSAGKWTCSLQLAPVGKGTWPLGQTMATPIKTRSRDERVMIEHANLLTSVWTAWLPSELQSGKPLMVDMWLPKKPRPVPIGRIRVAAWLTLSPSMNEPENESNAPRIRPLHERYLPVTTIKRRDNPSLSRPLPYYNAIDSTDVETPGSCLAYLDFDNLEGHRTHLKLTLDDGFESAVQKVLTPKPTKDDIIALSKFARLEVVGVYPLEDAAEE